MTATSPYAPRRQSSTLSAINSNGATRFLQRSTSLTNSATAGLFWFFLRFWRKQGVGADSASNDTRKIRHVLDRLADMIASHLTIADPRASMDSSDGNNSSTVLSKSCNNRRRGLRAVLQWVVSILGGDKSRLGKVIVTVVGFSREILLRTIFATNVILTGVPNSAAINCRSENSAAESPILNGESMVTYSNRSVSEIDVISQDRSQIDQVLKYWFGQASPDNLQKSLWMIASSSEELLRQVDADISDKFRFLIWDLFSDTMAGENPNAGDGLDTTTSSLDNGKLQRWTECAEFYGWQGKVAAIILLDQMSRHIHRHDQKHQNNINQQPSIPLAKFIPKQKELDSLAYKISTTLQKHHCKELSTGMIPLPMRIFGIMPLRHASTVHDLGIVQNDVELGSTLNEEMDRMIRRFRKATNRRMAALQDDARRNGKLGLLNEENGRSSSTGDENMKMYESDNANTEKNGGEIVSMEETFQDDQILECFPFEADMTPALDHIVTKTIRTFLNETNVLHTTDLRSNGPKRKSKSSHDKPSSMNSSTPDHVPAAIVSLSGGVDSMVIASALACIRDAEATRLGANPDDILRIYAIHIDYANRPEAGAEAAYVERYSRQLGAEFVCRRIGEVTRGVTARDDYERIAREIRFGLYRQCCKEAKGSNSDVGIGIMLGHHRGDLRENVISNAHRGCGPLDLSGMTSVSKNDGVTLFRPLLPLEKSAIFDYAHTFGVPYFKDTTPNWSTRGKLRNRLLPLLEEIYGEGSMDNLSTLAEESDDARALLQQTIISPFKERVRHLPMGIIFETSQWKDCGLFFWKFVLRDALHSAGRGMFSDKSVESFLKRIRAKPVREGWLQCRKDYAVYLKKNGTVLIFHPSSFPFHKNDQYEKSSISVGFGLTNKIKVGPWNISSEISPAASEKEANELLQRKAFECLEQLMSGDVHYFISAPIAVEGDLPRPLAVVSGFTKQTRPTAWKGSDLKVESTLPLLGVNTCDDVVGAVPEFGKTWSLVKIQLLLDGVNKT